MAKRKLIHIGDEEEEYLRSVIAGDIPKVTPEAIKSFEKKKSQPEPTQPESDSLEQTHPEEEPVERVARKTTPQRTAGRKKMDTKEFEQLFLVKRLYAEKRQTYINKDIYNRMLRYMSVITKEVSLTTYFDNILLKHLEDYEDVISGLYNESVNKPI